jgi:hypothetical protein
MDLAAFTSGTHAIQLVALVFAVILLATAALPLGRP